MTKTVLYLEHNMDGTVGGSHYCLLEICRHLDQSRFKPLVCFFQENSLLEEFRQTGVKIAFRSAMVPFRWTSSMFPRIAKGLQATVNAIRTLGFRSIGWILFLTKNSVDLVHLNNACGFDHDLMLAARLLRIPCVVHERGIQERITGATRFFSRRLDRIVTISAAVNQNLLDQGIARSKLLRIDDGIDLLRIAQETPVAQLRSTWAIPENAPVLGIVGNIKPWKGQETVVRALVHLKADFSDIRCFFVGSVADANYHSELERLIVSHGLERNVVFTGYQKRPTDLMAIFDVCLHASIAPEPFGIVLLEAMGKGKPVIATGIGGPLEIVVQGSTGYLVEPGNAEDLTNSVATLLRDETLRIAMGARAKQRVEQHYTIDQNIKKIESLYDELIKS